MNIYRFIQFGELRGYFGLETLISGVFSRRIKKKTKNIFTMYFYIIFTNILRIQNHFPKKIKKSSSYDVMGQKKSVSGLKWFQILLNYSLIISQIFLYK